jgi:hypothetical protein
MIKTDASLFEILESYFYVSYVRYLFILYKPEVIEPVTAPDALYGAGSIIHDMSH